jgi:hypothetical protein
MNKEKLAVSLIQSVIEDRGHQSYHYGHSLQVLLGDLLLEILSNDGSPRLFVVFSATMMSDSSK